jgi:hypothetical protein
MANPQTQPQDVCNRALDMIGAPAIADMQEGSRESRVAIRHYGPSVRALLRAVHWNFARTTQPLVLLFDATQGQPVPIPWLYEYAYPQDAVQIRFLPMLTTPPPGLVPPLMTNMPLLPTVSGTYPTPFVIAADNGITVILSNVQQASAVYTSANFNPLLWDSLFMDAVVAILASKFAVPLLDDKKLAIALRNEQIAAAKEMIGDARAANGNEAWSTADHTPDWIRIRGAGGWPYGFWTSNVPGTGLGFIGYSPLTMADGSAY